MNKLIEIQENDGERAVSARKLYETLGLVKGKFARFATKYIIKNEFAFEFDDWVGLDIDVEGNKTKDYALSLPFAKKICMLSKTQKGEEVRNYFLEMEKLSTGKKELSTPKNYIEALKALVISEEEKQKAMNTVAILTHVKKTYTATEIAKELGLKSASELNKTLKERKIQYKVNNTWVLCSEYSDLGYEQIKQQEINGIVIYDRKWTQRGREWLLSDIFKK